MAFLSTVLIAGGIVAGCFVLEVLFPAEPDAGIASRLEDFLLFVLNTGVFIAIEPLLSMVVGGLPSLRLLERLDAIGPPSRILEQILSTVVYALVWDFFQYWTHRAEHRIPFLWRFHRTHHDGRVMSSSTSLRQSLGATFIGFVCTHLPTVCILGYTGLSYVGGIILFSAWGYYNHANVQIEIPIFNRVLSGPHVHHLHHTQQPQLYGCNLAAFFPFYDRMFGTYASPQRNTRLSTLAPRPQTSGVRRFIAAWLFDRSTSSQPAGFVKDMPTTPIPGSSATSA